MPEPQSGDILNIVLNLTGRIDESIAAMRNQLREIATESDRAGAASQRFASGAEQKFLDLASRLEAVLNTIRTGFTGMGAEGLNEAQRGMEQYGANVEGAMASLAKLRSELILAGRQHEGVDILLGMFGQLNATVTELSPKLKQAFDAKAAQEYAAAVADVQKQREEHEQRVQDLMKLNSEELERQKQLLQDQLTAAQQNPGLKSPEETASLRQDLSENALALTGRKRIEGLDAMTQQLDELTTQAHVAATEVRSHTVTEYQQMRTQILRILADISRAQGQLGDSAPEALRERVTAVTAKSEAAAKELNEATRRQGAWDSIGGGFLRGAMQVAAGFGLWTSASQIVGFAINTVKSGLHEWEKQEEVTAKLTGTLESLGGNYERLTPVIRELSNELLRYGFQSENTEAAIQKFVQRGFTMEQSLGAVRIAAKLAVLEGNSLEGSVMALTRAATGFIRPGTALGQLLGSVRGQIERGGDPERNLAIILESLTKIEPSVNRMLDTTAAKSRTLARAVATIAEHLQSLYGSTSLWVAVQHGRFAEEADAMAQRLKETLAIAKIETIRISPVLGVHTGPGIVGASVVPFSLMSDLI